MRSVFTFAIVSICLSSFLSKAAVRCNIMLTPMGIFTNNQPKTSREALAEEARVIERLSEQTGQSAPAVKLQIEGIINSVGEWHSGIYGIVKLNKYQAGLLLEAALYSGKSPTEISVLFENTFFIISGTTRWTTQSSTQLNMCTISIWLV